MTVERRRRIVLAAGLGLVATVTATRILALRRELAGDLEDGETGAGAMLTRSSVAVAGSALTVESAAVAGSVATRRSSAVAGSAVTAYSSAVAGSALTRASAAVAGSAATALSAAVAGSSVTVASTAVAGSVLTFFGAAIRRCVLTVACSAHPCIACVACSDWSTAPGVSAAADCAVPLGSSGSRPVTAPALADDTVAAYLANTPVA